MKGHRLLLLSWCISFSFDWCTNSRMPYLFPLTIDMSLCFSRELKVLFLLVSFLLNYEKGAFERATMIHTYIHTHDCLINRSRTALALASASWIKHGMTTLSEGSLYANWCSEASIRSSKEARASITRLQLDPKGSQKFYDQWFCSKLWSASSHGNQ